MGTFFVTHAKLPARDPTSSRSHSFFDRSLARLSGKSLPKNAVVHDDNHESIDIPEDSQLKATVGDARPVEGDQGTGSVPAPRLSKANTLGVTVASVMDVFIYGFQAQQLRPQARSNTPRTIAVDKMLEVVKREADGNESDESDSDDEERVKVLKDQHIKEKLSSSSTEEKNSTGTTTSETTTGSGRVHRKQPSSSSESISASEAEKMF